MLIIHTIVLVLFYSILLFLLGVSLQKFDLKVGYTRKVVHFSMFIAPSLYYDIISLSDSILRLEISIISSLFIILLMSSFVRDRIHIVNVMFMAIDRHEDRPYTLFWLVTQAIIGYMVLGMFYFLFLKLNIPVELLYITILSTVFGDGLAEPVGLKFGRRRYSTKGFYNKKIYYRTIEGSLTVFISSVIITLFFVDSFSQLGFILMLTIFPIIFTLTEAKSPHTWDTPFLFLFGNTVVLLLYFV